MFHPQFFFSSRFFCEFISTLELRGKSFLEIGCGSGVVSLTAFRKGAVVTAVDVNPAAVENTRTNFTINFPQSNGVEIVCADLYSSIGTRKFDVIAVNPPYYFRKVSSATEQAWNAGENGDYFIRLFAGLRSHLESNGKCFMVISDAADTARIKAIALSEQTEIASLMKKKVRWETNFIWEITPVALN